MKKYIILFLAGLFLAGCPARERKEGIIIWHWMTDRESTFEILAEEYKNLHGVSVTFELYAPSEAYSQKVRAAAQVGNLPDIYGILSAKKDFASFIIAGHIVDLTEEMEKNNGEWKNKFFIKAILPNSFEKDNQYDVPSGIYGAPIDITNIQMIYNKGLFKKAGLDPEAAPDTWQKFIEYGEKLKNAGIPVFVSGFGETWLIENFAMNYAFNIMGEEKVMNTFAGKVPYTDTDWIKVFNLFKEMAEKELITDDSVTMINKVAEQTFANERAAFSFNGSWCVNVYKGMNPDLNYSPMLPPSIGKYPMVVWGGAGSSFVVNDKSSMKEDAIRFLRWLTDEKQQVFLSERTLNLPSNKNSLDSIKDEVLVEFAGGMYHTTHPNIWPLTENPQVREVMNKGIQRILIREITPAQLAKQIQNKKDDVKKYK